MKLHQDNIELGTKVYRYRLEEGDTYQLSCKVGVVEKDLVARGYRDPVLFNRGKKIVFDSGDPIYFARNKDRSIVFEECNMNRVLLLENNPQRAKELFIKHEEDKIASLYEEIKKHEEKRDKLREDKK